MLALLSGPIRVGHLDRHGKPRTHNLLKTPVLHQMLLPSWVAEWGCGRLPAPRPHLQPLGLGRVLEQPLLVLRLEGAGDTALEAPGGLRLSAFPPGQVFFNTCDGQVRGCLFQLREQRDAMLVEGRRRRRHTKMRLRRRKRRQAT